MLRACTAPVHSIRPIGKRFTQQTLNFTRLREKRKFSGIELSRRRFGEPIKAFLVFQMSPTKVSFVVSTGTYRLGRIRIGRGSGCRLNKVKVIYMRMRPYGPRRSTWIRGGGEIVGTMSHSMNSNFGRNECLVYIGIRLETLSRLRFDCSTTNFHLNTLESIKDSTMGSIHTRVEYGTGLRTAHDVR